MSASDAVVPSRPGKPCLPNGLIAGMTMLLGFTVSFGFILPINAPQNMVCLGTGTFTAASSRRPGSR